MREINFYDFSENLIATYRRYLYTTNLVAESEPELRAAIWEAFSQPNVFVQQPLVTCIPAYEQASRGLDLIGRNSPPILAKQLKELNARQFDLERPLYAHQVEALKRAQEGRNLIVATGTGSGKTECFLLPILDDAARNPGDGVRAIIIYPMNALANDQLDRLRQLLANIPQITFGRYTGDTPEDRSKVSEEDLQGIPANERFSREELRAHPPHILLTNFAMLEYLLLRPGDADLFQQQRLRFVVLDEAHSYNGAQGIDVALLMRRLRETFAQSLLQFLLTSATLSEGDTIEARGRIAAFGQSLAGAQFEPDDVIFGRTVHGFASECQDVELADAIRAVPDRESFKAWLEALDDAAKLRSLIQASNLPNGDDAVQAQDVPTILFRLFHNWRPLLSIHQFISQQPRTIPDIAQYAFGKTSESAELAAQWLLVMAANARERADAAPLLPARFHFFFRGLSGATTCLSPNCTGRVSHPRTFWSKVYLEDRWRCEPPCESRLLPLKTCFQCGMPAVSAWLDEETERWQPLQPSHRQTGKRQVVMTWDHSFSETDDDEGDADEARDDEIELCLTCGRYREDQSLSNCCSSRTVIRLRRLQTDETGDLKVCPRCGTSASPFLSVLRDFRSGEDAATAVLAEQMMRALPKDPEQADALPAGGRRMLAFSDSRQRAAFFAPYLKRTTAETEYGKPLYDAICEEEKSNDGKPVTLEEVAKRFLREAKKRKRVLIRNYDPDQEIITYQSKLTRDLRPDDERQIKRQAYIELLRHFCASSRQRLNLPGMGIAAASISRSKFARDRARVGGVAACTVERSSLRQSFGLQPWAGN